MHQPVCDVTISDSHAGGCEANAAFSATLDMRGVMFFAIGGASVVLAASLPANRRCAVC